MASSVDFRELEFPCRSVEEMTVEGTAAALDIPQATVRSRHFRAKSLLRDSLAQRSISSSATCSNSAEPTVIESWRGCSPGSMRPVRPAASRWPAAGLRRVGVRIEQSAPAP